MISRRTLLVGSGAAILGAPVAVLLAQPAGRGWGIGWVGGGGRGARGGGNPTPPREGLRELGYIEGKNVSIDARWSEGSEEQLKRDAADFVRLGVDVIVTHGGLGGIIAKKATRRFLSWWPRPPTSSPRDW